MNTNYYPISPKDLPENFTALTPSYQFKAFLAILSIIVFFVLYFALVAGTAYLTYLAVLSPIALFGGSFQILIRLKN